MKTLMRYKNAHAGDLQGFTHEMTAPSGDFDGASGRHLKFVESKYTEFIGETLIDIFNTKGYLKSKVGLQITYIRSAPEFYLLVDDDMAKNTYRYEISDMELILPVVKISESLVPMVDALTDYEPARYYFESLIAKQYNLGIDTQIAELPNVFSKRIPQRFIVCMYSQTALAGGVTKNPFLTSTEPKIRALKIKLNGIVVREVNPNFEDGKYTSCYKSFLEFVGVDDEQYMIGMYRAFYQL